MASRDQRRLRAGDKFAEELHTVVSFLDPHLAARARTTGKPGLWSWRKAIVFVVVTGLIGWSAVLGLAWLLFSLWN
jgi:hypothetical protein